MASQTADIAIKRVTQIFRYLENLNQLRNPAVTQIDEQPWRLWLRDLPDHVAVKVGNAPVRTQAEPTEEATNSDTVKRDEFLLRVSRPTLTRSPQPPASISDWLESGWERFDGRVSVRGSRNRIDANGNTILERFEEDPARSVTLSRWTVSRDEWVANERPARAAMKLFEGLYELHGRLEREGERYEIVLGDGILNWRREDGGVSHPILLQRAQLAFDPETPEFIIREADHGPELYTAIFRTMCDVDGRRLGKCRDQVEKEFYHPFGDSETTAFLKSFVNQLASGAEYLDKAGDGVVDHPRVWRDPVFFLRSRSLGFASALECILDALEQGPELPISLLNISGAATLMLAEAPLGDVSEPTSVPATTEVLFSKPSNKEQFQIAARLSNAGCVLVQGPPGTGKTHTIANLIGHLLAAGKSVLVTSQTTKALRVLREQVVPKLQPLCVSVLESDMESRRQLEASVAGIVRRLAEDNPEALRRRAEELTSRRSAFVQRKADLSQELLSVRADEYREIVVSGKGYTPSEAARFVRANESSCSWIPCPVNYGSPLPLSEAEVSDLYSTNRVLSQADENELAHPVPEIAQLLTPADFESTVVRISELDRTGQDFKSSLWHEAARDRIALGVLLARLLEAAKLLRTSGSDSVWKLTVIEAGRRGAESAKTWRKLLEEIARVQEQAERLQDDIFRFGPEAASDCLNEESLHAVDEILGHLSEEKSVGWIALMLHSSWKRLVGGTRFDGRPPRTAAEFRVMRAFIELECARARLCDRWRRQMEPLGAFDAKQLGEAPEHLCAQYSRPIEDCLGWFDSIWKPLEAELGTVLNWEALLSEAAPVVSTMGDLLRLRSTIELLPRMFAARSNLLERSGLDLLIAALVRTVEQYVTSEGMSVATLRDAAVRRDTTSYAHAFERLVELHQLNTIVARRRELITRAAVSAPGWSAAISRRDPPHDKNTVPAGRPEDAWLWRQLHVELERRSKTSIHELQRAIEDLDGQLIDITAELIDCRAWSEQLSRTGTPQRQALIGWLDTVRRIGRGTGKRVPRLLEEAKRLMNESRSAVPVWIMPLARVVDNFQPRPGLFDVLVIDEASQCDVMGLIAIFMAKQVAIVGDHQQVSPDAVGQRLDQVQHLIDTHLAGIPNSHLYDGQMSVYDLARQSFDGLICLREHYRCVPEIIHFSNMLSYDGQIRPLRDPATTALRPHVIAHRVEGTRAAKSKTNQVEADHVCALLSACIEQPEYAHKTFGIISLMGEDQAQLIETQLRSRLSPAELTRRRLLCGNAAHFQGDERDVMFLSVVDTAADGPLASRDTEAFRKRYNVAASRAKDQMWVIHSLNPDNDLKPGDLRRRLIEYAINPAAFANAIAQQEARAESEFEKQVFRRLTGAGYRVISQKEVGYCRIDFVVEGGGCRLAVECDGDRYHPIEKLAADMERQAVLERLGWKFVRIRGSEFYRDPDAAIAPVFARLELMGIPKEGSAAVAGSDQSACSSELSGRVIRRADAILAEWGAEQNPAMNEDSDTRLQAAAAV